MQLCLTVRPIEPILDSGQSALRILWIGGSKTVLRVLRGAAKRGRTFQTQPSRAEVEVVNPEDEGGSAHLAP